MARRQTADSVSQIGKPVSRRIVEITCGLVIILIAVGASKFWIETRNARRADSFLLRRSVQLTLETARLYQADNSGEPEIVAAWERFLAAAPEQDLDPRPAHEFADSFMVKYRDGRLDSLEAGQLYQQLMSFRPKPD